MRRAGIRRCAAVSKIPFRNGQRFRRISTKGIRKQGRTRRKGSGPCGGNIGGRPGYLYVLGGRITAAIRIGNLQPYQVRSVGSIGERWGLQGRNDLVTI